MISLLLASWVIVVPSDYVPGNWPNDQVWLHECGHARGAIDGIDALIPGTPLWVNPKFDCLRLGAPRNMEVLRAPTVTTTEICRIMGGKRYACSWPE